MGYCASMSKSNFHVKTENTGRVIAKIQRFGYIPKLDNDGNIVEIDFEGERLGHDEDVMFNAIAPYVEDGSFIEMVGEDGDRWRWVFKNGECKEIKAKMTWNDE